MFLSSPKNVKFVQDFMLTLKIVLKKTFILSFILLTHSLVPFCVEFLLPVTNIWSDIHCPVFIVPNNVNLSSRWTQLDNFMSLLAFRYFHKIEQNLFIFIFCRNSNPLWPGGRGPKDLQLSKLPNALNWVFKIQGVPQFCSNFCLVDFLATKAPRNSILDIFQ